MWPAWQAFSGETITATSLKFYLAPLINSASRVADVYDGVQFLLSSDQPTAETQLSKLRATNTERKLIQQELWQETLNASYKASNSSICLVLTHGHVGINGIVASKLANSIGKPVVLFTQRGQQLVGSARSAHNLHLKEILDAIYASHPNIIIKYGGHVGAAGLSIYAHQFDLFTQRFEEEVSLAFRQNSMRPGAVLEHDGQLPDMCPKEVMTILNGLEPFGQGFKVVTFYNKVEILKYIYLKNKHYLMHILLHDRVFKAWFFDTEVRSFSKHCNILFEITPDLLTLEECTFIIKYVENVDE